MRYYYQVTISQPALEKSNNHEPEKQGKPLSAELAGYRSIRAVGQRYHIIFKMENDLILVTVVAIGIRKEGDKKDAYALAKKLARLDLLDEKGQF